MHWVHALKAETNTIYGYINYHNILFKPRIKIIILITRSEDIVSDTLPFYSQTFEDGFMT